MTNRNVKTVLKKKYIREHCVPTKELLPRVLCVLCLENEPHDKLVFLIEKFCRIAYLTKGEARKVDVRYKKTLPSGWAPTKRSAWLARYRKFGIKLKRPPKGFMPDLSGRKAEMDYAKLGWSSDRAAKEIVKLWNAGLCEPSIPIRAILVGYSHSNPWMSEKCRELWDAASA